MAHGLQMPLVPISLTSLEATEPQLIESRNGCTTAFSAPHKCQTTLHQPSRTSSTQYKECQARQLDRHARASIRRTSRSEPLVAADTTGRVVDIAFASTESAPRSPVCVSIVRAMPSSCARTHHVDTTTVAASPHPGLAESVESSPSAEAVSRALLPSAPCLRMIGPERVWTCQPRRSRNSKAVSRLDIEWVAQLAGSFRIEGYAFPFALQVLTDCGNRPDLHSECFPFG
jgi:hypothetical protein